MLNELKEQAVQCPYCGESIDVLIDCSVARQDYVEDCQVCCRPILFSVSVETDGTVGVDVAQENG